MKRKKLDVMDIIIGIIMVIVMVVMLYPFLLIVASSLSDPVLVMQNKVGIIPKGFTLQNYEMIFQKNDIWPSYWNKVGS